MSKIEQPSWCDYLEADTPIWGCWSLWFGMVTGEDYCKTCEFYKKGGEE